MDKIIFMVAFEDAKQFCKRGRDHTRLLQGWGGFWPNPWFLDCIRIEPPEKSGSEYFSMISDYVGTHHNRYWHQNSPEPLETHFRTISVQKRQDPEIRQPCSGNGSSFRAISRWKPMNSTFSTGSYRCWTRVFSDLLSFEWSRSINVYKSVTFWRFFRPFTRRSRLPIETSWVPEMAQITFSTGS